MYFPHMARCPGEGRAGLAGGSMMASETHAIHVAFCFSFSSCSQVGCSPPCITSTFQAGRGQGGKEKRERHIPAECQKTKNFPRHPFPSHRLSHTQWQNWISSSVRKGNSNNYDGRNFGSDQKYRPTSSQWEQRRWLSPCDQGHASFYFFQGVFDVQ